MKTLVTVLLVGMTSLSVLSQANNAAFNVNSRMIDLDEKARAFGLTEAEYRDTEGSPYATKEFMPGVIYKGKEIAQPKVSLRYNIFADEIEIKNIDNGMEQYNALIKDPEIYVKILNDLFLFVPFEGSVEKGGYFQILSDGTSFDLYKKYSVTYHPPAAAKTSFDRAHRASFKQTENYYLVNENGDFYELPHSKSKILKVMSQKEKQLKQFIKDENLVVTKEADLIKLVNYYNTLL